MPRSCAAGCGRSPTSQVSFTIISILSGCLTLFYFAMNVGGPAVMTIGWLVVGFFVTLVALGMAEVASSYPTAGGLYYWAAKLAPESAATRGMELVRRLVQLRRPGRRHGGHRLRAGVLHQCVPEHRLGGLDGAAGHDPHSRRRVVHPRLLNTFGIRLVKLLNDVSVWWHVVGVAAIVLVTVVLNQHSRTDLGTVFSTFVNNTGSGGENRSGRA
jgi:preprotein translocase subunit SecG